MDRELLEKILLVQSDSGSEYRMQCFLTQWLSEHGFNWEFDTIGNIFVTKGETYGYYPCIVSHIDTVHDIISDYKLYRSPDRNGVKNNIYFAGRKDGGKAGVGGDDKCGIYACLDMLQRFDNIKVAFFVQEEVGCVGSSKADKGWFSDCGYIIQLDRKGNSDFIAQYNWEPTISDLFDSAVGDIIKSYGYNKTEGVYTDSIRMWDDGVGISCVNISCGYYNPHSDDEYICVSDLENSVEMTYDIMCTLGEYQYPSHPEPKKYSRSRRIGWGRYYDEDNEAWDNYYNSQFEEDDYWYERRKKRDSERELKLLNKYYEEQELSKYDPEDYTSDNLTAQEFINCVNDGYDWMVFRNDKWYKGVGFPRIITTGEKKNVSNYAIYREVVTK